MSTANATAHVQTGQEVVLPERGPSELTEPKFTAEQIEKDCPDQLQQLGDEIAVRIKKTDKQLEQAENHLISINKLIKQAQELCDGGGFRAFQKKFFPELGKSRIYELLAIGADRKSVEEIRASTRARVAKHRANKAVAPPSVTVTDKSKPAPDIPIECGKIAAPSSASEQS
jgi:hypothetical protein